MLKRCEDFRLFFMPFITSQLQCLRPARLGMRKPFPATTPVAGYPTHRLKA
jgi:hypothetical protein